MRGTPRVVVFAIALAAIVPVAAAVAAPAAPAGYQRVLSGKLSGKAAYVYFARERAGKLCLRIEARRAGDWASNRGRCEPGTLKSRGSIVARWNRTAKGDTIVANVVHGIVPDRATRLVLTMSDGRKRSATPSRGPAALRVAMGEPIRFYVIDAMRISTRRPSTVKAFDAAGRLVATARF